MATSLQKVYDAFLVKMLEDEWVNWEESEVNEDLYNLLEGAIPWFKFPRVSLEHDENAFNADLSNDEI
ncbi:MAG: hypothetical protein LIR46_03485 [Bacteroidota bacterium]|nr:hypothetical protein [Bacteroidota bacterium]